MLRTDDTNVIHPRARRHGLDDGKPAQGGSARDLEMQVLALETDLLSPSRLAA